MGDLFLKKAGISLITACAAWGLFGYAHANPVMDIVTNSIIGDHEPIFHPGVELLVQYTVTNNSPQNPDDEMNRIILPAGSRQGIYSATAPADWTYAVNANETIFTTIVPGAQIQSNQGQGIFELYSTLLTTGLREATAYTPLDQPFNPVTIEVPAEQTFSSDIYFDGIVDLKDYVILASQWQMIEPNIIDPGIIHYEDTQNGITVQSDVYYSSSQDAAIFMYTIQNNSGDTLLQVSFNGEEWAGGYGLYQTWDIDTTNSASPNQDNIRFYNNVLDNGNVEEFVAASNLLDTRAIGQMALEGSSGQTYHLKILAPFVAVTLDADIVDDDVVDIGDLIALCDQWLNTETWHIP